MHQATMPEVATRFAYNIRRRQILAGLEWVVARLREHNVETILLDGSFVTVKLRPSDVDVVFVPPAAADTATWGILALGRRHELKAAHRVDLWPWPSLQPNPAAPSGFSSIKG